MRKKHKIYRSPTVRIEPLPKTFVASVSMSNLQEQKTRFLKHGKTPMFVVQGDTSTVEELAAKSSGKIRFDLLGEAEYILHIVKQKYGVGENYLEHIYGPRIDQDEANKILFDYIQENSLQESLSVYWSNEMSCSARMIWKGYSFKCNRPEARRYSLWLNGTHENPYLRRQGLQCLLDHEIGTHFYRSYNDGFQPWFYDRKKFGLRGAGSFESLCTEEGLASINTTLRAREKYLWLSALTYYTACKSTEMTFKQLFDHLGQFVENPEQRWKHVMRVKRGLVDPNDLGGYGKDQCYFEGAVTILRNIDNINFNLLMSGKICYDEVSRVKRMARLGSVYMPAIMRDMDSYRKQLKKMAVINGLHLSHATHEPPRAYVQRLKERQAGIHRRKKVRKGKKLRISPSKVSGSLSEDSKSSSLMSKQSKESNLPSKQSGLDQRELSNKKQRSGSNVQQIGSGVKGSASASPDLASSQQSCPMSARKVWCSSSGDPLALSLVSGSKGSQDHSSAAGCSWQVSQDFQPPVSKRTRPYTACHLHKPSLPDLYQNCEKFHSKSKESLTSSQSEDGDSTSPDPFKGQCRVCVDSVSIEDLSLSDEELESWLYNLSSPSSCGSPCPDQVSHFSLPPISQQCMASSAASTCTDSEPQSQRSVRSHHPSSTCHKAAAFQCSNAGQSSGPPVS